MGFKPKWSEETVEQAYQVWSTAGMQQAPATVKLMSSLYSVTIAPTTLYAWVKAHGWDERYHRELSAGTRNPQDMHPELLQVAALAAVTYLTQVVRGEVEPDMVRVKAAATLESAARALLPRKSASVQGKLQPIVAGYEEEQRRRLLRSLPQEGSTDRSA
jgi:hypothetical protein